jgi:hypothetical protein
LLAEWLQERARFIGSLVGLTDEQFNAELTVRYAVLDQLRTFEFRLAMAHDHPRADREAVVKMWPASLVLRLFVSPVYLLFTRDGRAFRGMIGRLLPVTVQHGKVRPIDGELVLDAAADDSGGGRR